MVRTVSACVRSRSTTTSSGSRPVSAASTVAALTPFSSACSLSFATNSENSGRGVSAGAGTTVCADKAAESRTRLQSVASRTIDRDCLARDVTGRLRRQKDDEVGQLFGPPQATERNARDRGLPYIIDRFAALLRVGLIQLGDTLGIDPAGSDHIHKDALRRQLARQGLGGAPHTGAQRVR